MLDWWFEVRRRGETTWDRLLDVRDRLRTSRPLPLGPNSLRTWVPTAAAAVALGCIGALAGHALAAPASVSVAPAAVLEDAPVVSPPVSDEDGPGYGASAPEGTGEQQPGEVELAPTTGSDPPSVGDDASGEAGQPTVLGPIIAGDLTVGPITITPGPSGPEVAGDVPVTGGNGEEPDAADGRGAAPGRGSGADAQPGVPGSEPAPTSTSAPAPGSSPGVEPSGAAGEPASPGGSSSAPATSGTPAAPDTARTSGAPAPSAPRASGAAAASSAAPGDGSASPGGRPGEGAEEGGRDGTSAPDTARTSGAPAPSAPRASGAEEGGRDGTSAPDAAPSPDAQEGAADPGAAATDAIFALDGLSGFDLEQGGNIENGETPTSAPSPNVEDHEAVRVAVPEGGKRSEVRPDGAAQDIREGQRLFFGYSAFLPEGFPVDTDSFQVIWQLHDGETNTSPPVALEVQQGSLWLANVGELVQDLGPVTPGENLAVQMEIDFEIGGGAITVWRDGEEVVTDFRPPRGTMIDNFNFLKTGLYRDDPPDAPASELFINDLRVGDSLESVSGLAGSSPPSEGASPSPSVLGGALLGAAVPFGMRRWRRQR